MLLSKGEVLHNQGEVLLTSGRTVTNQGRTVTMEARAKCEKGEVFLIRLASVLLEQWFIVLAPISRKR